jgi:hypothetical protein
MDLSTAVASSTSDTPSARAICVTVLHGSFASLLIFEGPKALEVAAQLGHQPSTCLDIYGRLFEEFDPAQRRPAVKVIR